MRDFLMHLMERATGHLRYHPELEELSGKTHWSKDNLIFNVFRAYEWLFGRRLGIKPEFSTEAAIINGKVHVNFHIFSFEALLVHTEAVIRMNLKALYLAIKSLLMLDFQPQIDYRPAIVTLGILGLLFHFETTTQHLPLFGLAIAYDAPGSGDPAGTASSLTYSHTTAGSNRYLAQIGFLYFNGVGDSGDKLTGITYATVAETLIDKQVTPGGVYQRWAYSYNLINPTVGANNVVISVSDSTDRPLGYSISYSGAKQSGQPDAHVANGSATATSLTTSLTTIADNCWMVSWCHTPLDSTNASTNVTVRANEFTGKFGDSNGAITPAGSFSMTWTTPTLGPMNVLQFSIAPASNIKTIQGLAAGSVKTIEGLAIASVKTVEGLVN